MFLMLLCLIKFEKRSFVFPSLTNIRHLKLILMIRNIKMQKKQTETRGICTEIFPGFPPSCCYTHHLLDDGVVRGVHAGAHRVDALAVAVVRRVSGRSQNPVLSGAEQELRMQGDDFRGIKEKLHPDIQQD